MSDFLKAVSGIDNNQESDSVLIADSSHREEVQADAYHSEEVQTDTSHSEEFQADISHSEDFQADISHSEEVQAETSHSEEVQADALLNEQVLVYVPLEHIKVEKQVRKKFDTDYISDLANDIKLAKDKQPTSPIALWLKGEEYVLAMGENRYQAMQLNAEENQDNPQVIKSIVIGKYPRTKSDRLQGQIKENLLRKSLNLGELALALQTYFKENPKANNVEAAKWCGYVNSASGRKKIAKAKLLMDADPELLQKVVDGEMSEAKAISEIKKQDNSEPLDAPSFYQKSEIDLSFSNIAEAFKSKDEWTLKDILQLVKSEFENKDNA